MGIQWLQVLNIWIHILSFVAKNQDANWPLLWNYLSCGRLHVKYVRFFCLMFQSLPHDAYKLLAVPSPIGGVLIIGANTIHYHSQVWLLEVLKFSTSTLNCHWFSVAACLSCSWFIDILIGQSASCALALNNFAVPVSGRWDAMPLSFLLLFLHTNIFKRTLLFICFQGLPLRSLFWDSIPNYYHFSNCYCIRFF